MIICCGEALIDMLPRKFEEDGADHTVFLPKAGGSIFNTAIALGRLGHSTGFFSGISQDHFGELLSKELKNSHVDSSFAHRSALPTTLAVVALKNGSATYSFYDEGSAGRMLSKENIPDIPSSAKALQFGGISLTGGPCAEAYEALFITQAPKAVLALDPNIRESFIQDADSYRARLTRMMAKADILKISSEDLEWIAPDKNAKSYAEDIAKSQNNICLMTHGSDGVEAFTRDFSFHLDAEDVEVVDTVGAGDTFNAGILASLKDQGLLDKEKLKSITMDQLKTAAGFGSKIAAVTVSRAGANPPWKHEL